jgi:hypothetical protein
MPRLVPFRLAAACALALLFSLSVAAAASSMIVDPAKGVVSLRVVGAGGKVLAEKPVGTKSTSLETSRKATCLGAGTGGSGRSVKVKGGTALAALAAASKSTAALRPLSVTDHYLAEFGLGICGVGKSKATSKLSWYLKVDHRGATKGGEQTKVHAGDEVLWALEPYPYPEELSLVAPFSAHPGVPFEVTVYSYDEKGKKKPAAGATVTGASGPTDAGGHAMVTLSESAALVAREGKDIPSQPSTVVMCDPSGACPVS